jgi:hypothetical protein
MSQDEQTARASAIQAEYVDELMQKANVVGVAVGLAKKRGQVTNQIALVVMVSEKVPLDELAPEDRIPPMLDSVPVDVQEVGVFTAF